MLKSLIFLCIFSIIFCETTFNVHPINFQPKKSVIFPCPAGWTYLAEYGKCLLPTPQSLTWHQAEAYCEEHGANLMSIHSRDEVKRASDLVLARFWIGVYKYVDIKEDTWKFANNDMMNYIPWVDSGNSRCGLGENNYVFQSQSCDDKYQGICQIYATV